MSGQMRLSAALRDDSLRRSWLVLDGDWGGQIYASFPLALLPSDLSIEAVRALLGAMDKIAWDCNEGDGADCHIEQDLGPVTDQASWDAALARAPEKMVPADLFKTSQTDFTPRLEGWIAVGDISGGMGGGLLLENDAWFHAEFLEMGLEEVNRLRAMLRIKPLETLAFVASGDDDRE